MDYRQLKRWTGLGSIMGMTLVVSAPSLAANPVDNDFDLDQNTYISETQAETYRSHVSDMGMTVMDHDAVLDLIAEARDELDTQAAMREHDPELAAILDAVERGDYPVIEMTSCVQQVVNGGVLSVYSIGEVQCDTGHLASWTTTNITSGADENSLFTVYGAGSGPHDKPGILVLLGGKAFSVTADSGDPKKHLAFAGTGVSLVDGGQVIGAGLKPTLFAGWDIGVHGYGSDNKVVHLKTNINGSTGVLFDAKEPVISTLAANGGVSVNNNQVWWTIANRNGAPLGHTGIEFACFTEDGCLEMSHNRVEFSIAKKNAGDGIAFLRDIDPSDVVDNHVYFSLSKGNDGNGINFGKVCLLCASVTGAPASNADDDLNTVKFNIVVNNGSEDGYKDEDPLGNGTAGILYDFSSTSGLSGQHSAPAAVDTAAHHVEFKRHLDAAEESIDNFDMRLFDLITEPAIAYNLVEGNVLDGIHVINDSTNDTGYRVSYNKVVQNGFSKGWVIRLGFATTAGIEVSGYNHIVDHNWVEENNGVGILGDVAPASSKSEVSALQDNRFGGYLIIFNEVSKTHQVLLEDFTAPTVMCSSLTAPDVIKVGAGIMVGSRYPYNNDATLGSDFPVIDTRIIANKLVKNGASNKKKKEDSSDKPSKKLDSSFSGIDATAVGSQVRFNWVEETHGGKVKFEDTPSSCVEVGYRLLEGAGVRIYGNSDKVDWNTAKRGHANGVMVQFREDSTVPAGQPFLPPENPPSYGPMNIQINNMSRLNKEYQLYDVGTFALLPPSSGPTVDCQNIWEDNFLSQAIYIQKYKSFAPISSNCFTS